MYRNKETSSVVSSPAAKVKYLLANGNKNIAQFVPVHCVQRTYVVMS